MQLLLTYIVLKEEGVVMPAERHCTGDEISSLSNPHLQIFQLCNPVFNIRKMTKQPLLLVCPSVR